MMKGFLLRVFLIFTVLLLIAVNFAGCSIKQEVSLITPQNSISHEMPSERPQNYNFTLDYGYGFNSRNPDGNANQVDTFKGTVSKDMVMDPPVSTGLRLSNDELDTIYKKMKDINILSYPDKFTPSSNSMVTPYETYRLKVQIDDTIKNIYWEDEDPYSNDTKAAQLRELFGEIKKIVSQREEYKKLPEPKGRYM